MARVIMCDFCKTITKNYKNIMVYTNSYSFIDEFNICENCYNQKFRVEINSLLKFIDECCDISEKEIISSLRDKKSEFKKIYYKWCDVNNYVKGKLKLKEIETTLKERYGEDLKKYDGYEKLKFIKIKKETYKELGIWRNEENE